MRKWGNEEMETRVQTGGLVVVPVRLWSTQPSVQLTGEARKGMILWGMRYDRGDSHSSHGHQFDSQNQRGSVESDKEGTCTRYVYDFSLSSSGSDSELLVAVISMTVPSLPEVSAIPYSCSVVSLLSKG